MDAGVLTGASDGEIELRAGCGGDRRTALHRIRTGLPAGIGGGVDVVGTGFGVGRIDVLLCIADIGAVPAGKAVHLHRGGTIGEEVGAVAAGPAIEVDQNINAFGRDAFGRRLSRKLADGDGLLKCRFQAPAHRACIIRAVIEGDQFKLAAVVTLAGVIPIFPSLALIASGRLPGSVGEVVPFLG